MLNIVAQFIDETGISMRELCEKTLLSPPTLKKFLTGKVSDKVKEKNILYISHSCNLPEDIVRKYAYYQGDITHNAKNKPRKKDPNAIPKTLGRPPKKQPITREEIIGMINDLRTEIIGE